MWYANYERTEAGNAKILCIMMSADTEQEAEVEAKEYLTETEKFSSPELSWSLVGLSQDDAPKPHGLIIRGKVRRIPIGTRISIKRKRAPRGGVWRTLNPAANLMLLAGDELTRLATRDIETLHGELEAVELPWQQLLMRKGRSSIRFHFDEIVDIAVI